jgi:hypothetical protein
MTTHDDWYGMLDERPAIPKGDSTKAILGLAFALLAFVLIALSFWFEATGG